LKPETFNFKQKIWACPFASSGSGYPLQVLVRRASSLWAFRCYPSRGFSATKHFKRNWFSKEF